VGKGNIHRGNKKGFSAKNPPNHVELRKQLQLYVSGDFHRNHVMYEGDTSSGKGATPGMRDVATSTAILVDRKAAQNLIQLAKSAGGAAPHLILTSPMSFRLYVWEGGKAEKIEATIRYCVCTDNKTSRKIIWHLDGVGDKTITGSRAEMLAAEEDDDYTSSSDEEDLADASVYLDDDEY
jgi:hypothetical protein